MLVPVFNLNTTYNGGSVNLTFPTQTGFSYQVQFENNPGDSAWRPLADIPGSNAIQTVGDATTAQAGFYRIVIH